MSKWDKLINDIINQNKNLRYNDLEKALIKMGYKKTQPSSGSSHFIFKKYGKQIISLPKATSLNKVYIKLVRDAVLDYECDGD